MRSTRFGAMVNLEFPFQIGDQFEVMTFEGKGSKHKHDIAEVAVCTGGSGFVWVDEERHDVGPGSMVVIPGKTYHYMEPSTEPMTFAIFYEA